MSKLKDYITEARNIKGDVGRVKKIFKKFDSNYEKLREKLYSDIGGIITSVDKSEDENGMSQFESWTMDMMHNTFGSQYLDDVIGDIEEIMYEKFWSKMK